MKGKLLLQSQRENKSMCIEPTEALLPKNAAQSQSLNVCEYSIFTTLTNEKMLKTK